MPINNLSERRRHPRVDFKCSVAITEAGLPETLLSLRLVNASDGGIALEGSSQLTVGRLYDLDFRLPDGAKIKAKAKVMWKKSNEFIQTYGLNFEEITWLGGRRLNHCVADILGVAPRREARRVFIWALAAAVAALWAQYVADYGWPAFSSGLLIGISIGVISWSFRSLASW